MNIEDLLFFAYPGTYLVMLALEAVRPAREYPTVKGWRGIGVVGLVMIVSVGIVTPMLLPVEWLERHRLIDATGLGVPTGTVVGYLVLSACTALWHRCLHKSKVLWRIHQTHHAPRRLDLSGGNVFHPLDIFLFTVVQVGALTLVIGLDPLAAALTGYVASFYTLFQHWNVRTPRWIGYVIQRPEAHGLHHELGVHGRNYSDLPLWDILLGSFASPKTFDGRVGFDRPSPARKLLLLADVNAPDGELDTPPSTQPPMIDAAAE